MANFVQFQYKEGLTGRSATSLEDFLKCNKSTSEEILILRLLTGTINFKNSVSGTQVNPRINFTLTDYAPNTTLTKKNVTGFFKDNGINFKKAQKYYGNSKKFGNKTFFHSLLLEITNFFHQSYRGSHTTGFLHLYRAIELMSYSFPLHYVSQVKNYRKTYSTLKSFFNKNAGEIAFGNQFINDILFKDDPLLEIALPIQIFAPNNTLEEAYFNLIKKLCLTDESKYGYKGSTPYNEIIISRKGIINLTVTLRNRYFHLLSGTWDDNLTGDELPESDYFFKIINNLILNWFTLIYVEILKNTIESHSN